MSKIADLERLADSRADAVIHFESELRKAIRLPPNLEAALRRQWEREVPVRTPSDGDANTFEGWLLERLSLIAYADQDAAILSTDGPWPYPEND